MLPLTKLATAAGIVLAVGLVGVLLFANRQSDVGSQPTVAPSASAAAVAAAPSVPTSTNKPPSPSPTAVSTAGWQTFSSNRYGYQIKYPSFLNPLQSTRQWTEADAADWLSPANDRFEGQVGVTAMAVTLPQGTSADAWIASHLDAPPGTSAPDACTHTRVNLSTRTVDTHPVTFWRESENGNCGGTFAFVVVGNRLHSFFIGLPGWEPTLEAMLSTVTFPPAG